MTKKSHNLPPNGHMLLYQSPDGATKLDVRLVNDTVWLNIDQIAELFGMDKSGISRHLKNICSSWELENSAVVAKSATTAADRKTCQVAFYNLEWMFIPGEAWLRR